LRDQGKPETGKQVAPVDTLNLILQELRQIRSLLVDQVARREKLMTVDQVLKQLEVSRTTFERWQQKGLIKVHSFGGKHGKGRGTKVYVKYSDLVKALKEVEVLKEVN